MDFVILQSRQHKTAARIWAVQKFRSQMEGVAIASALSQDGTGLYAAAKEMQHHFVWPIPVNAQHGISFAIRSFNLAEPLESQCHERCELTDDARCYPWCADSVSGLKSEFPPPADTSAPLQRHRPHSLS